MYALVCDCDVCATCTVYSVHVEFLMRTRVRKNKKNVTLNIYTAIILHCIHFSLTYREAVIIFK